MTMEERFSYSCNALFSECKPEKKIVGNLKPQSKSTQKYMQIFGKLIECLRFSKLLVLVQFSREVSYWKAQIPVSFLLLRFLGQAAKIATFKKSQINLPNMWCKFHLQRTERAAAF